MKTSLTAALVALAFAPLAQALPQAKTLQGNYLLASECEIHARQLKKIPAGLVEVIENVPIGDVFQSPFPAIILQWNGETQPILTLGIGRVAPFAYGSQPFSLGEYVQATGAFNETYFSPDHLQGRVTLSRVGDVLTLESIAEVDVPTTPPTNSSTCVFKRQP